MKNSTFPFPIFMPQIQQHAEKPSDNMAPIRIEKAMEFLQVLNQKTQSRIATTELKVDVIDGEKLTTEEISAQCTALDLLSKYFMGKLQPDTWERVAIYNNSKENYLNGKSMRLLKCLMCGFKKKPDPGCPLCEGIGNVLVASGMPTIDDIIDGMDKNIENIGTEKKESKETKENKETIQEESNES